MMATRRGRAQTCGVREARARLDDARAQLDLVEAVGLSTEGAERKAASHYGFDDLSGAQLTTAVRRARALVGWAERVVRG
jgi:hypothetical protein